MLINDPIKASRKPDAVAVVGHSSFSDTLHLVRAVRLARRIEAITAEDSDLSAKAIITDQIGRILILKSANDKWHDLPGGHVRNGEDAVTGLAREVREETGISIGDIKPFETVTLKLGRKTRPVQFFKATALSLDVRLSGEHLSYEWVQPSDLSRFNLGVLLAPIQRILAPAAVQATESAVRFMTESELLGQLPSHHETARRIAEKIYKAAIDNWLSQLNADLIAAIFGHKGMDYDGVGISVYGAAAGGWVAAMGEAARRAYAATAQTLGHDAGVNLKPSEEALKSFASSRGSALERFPVAVREKLAASIKRGVLGGEDARALGRRIDEAVREVQEGAGRRVAATEAQVTYGVSQAEVLELAGFKHKRWETVGDDRVRDSHYLCESQGPIPAGTPFHNGLQYPGDPNGDISEVANCRCNLVGVA